MGLKYKTIKCCQKVKELQLTFTPTLDDFIFEFIWSKARRLKFIGFYGLWFCLRIFKVLVLCWPFECRLNFLHGLVEETGFFFKLLLFWAIKVRTFLGSYFNGLLNGCRIGTWEQRVQSNAATIKYLNHALLPLKVE